MAKKTTLISTGTIAKNRKAHFNYAVHETLTGGIVLTGAEVKALRQGKVSINEAYAIAVDPDGTRDAAPCARGLERA